MATAVRTYLEMREPSALRGTRLGRAVPRIERVEDCPPEFYRFLYAAVGRRYHWVDRLSWSIEEIAAHLADPATSIWLMTVRGSPAGYFELHADAEGAVEIVYFGLLDQFVGQGLGAHLLTEAVERAWALDATRVWLHTCTMDHPAALPNYVKRGFTPYRTEEYSL